MRAAAKVLLRPLAALLVVAAVRAARAPQFCAPAAAVALLARPGVAAARPDVAAARPSPHAAANAAMPVRPAQYASAAGPARHDDAVAVTNGRASR